MISIAFPCLVIARTGGTCLVDTMDELLDLVRNDPIIDHGSPSLDADFPAELHGGWLVRDFYGRVVHWRDLDPPFAARAAAILRQRRLRRAPRHVFRRGPVPGTGKPTGRSICYFRNPRTTAVLRANASLDQTDDEESPPARGRRRDLPTAWDDIPRTRDRSWKRQRHTQWRR